MPQRRNYPFYQINLMFAMALGHVPAFADQIRGLPQNIYTSFNETESKIKLLMKNNNLIGMLAGYYLSRFDDIAYKRFPFTTQAEVHSFLAERIGVPASSLKLWRDEFDPIHSNSRKGWHKRKMAPSRVRMSEMLSGVSEVGLFQLLDSCMQRPDIDVLNLLQDAESANADDSFEFSTRNVTGLRAEEFFMSWYKKPDNMFHGPLSDCRQLQCGYDFKSEFAGAEAFVEVKGLKGDQGGILLTDKEWDVANENGDKFFLVLVRSVDSDSPTIEIFRNPASLFSPKQQVTTVIQVTWTISALDSHLAVNI